VLQPIQYKLATSLTTVNKQKLMTIIYMFIGMQLIAGLCLVFISPYIYRYFIGAEYHEGIGWIKYLVLAAFFSSCTDLFMNIVRQKATGKQLVGVNFYPLLLLIGLFFVLPNYFHISGVFYSYIIVNFLILVLSIRRSMMALEISSRLLVNHLKTSFGRVVN
jgi:O-antigen/teichoic acid export membrane protein